MYFLVFGLKIKFQEMNRIGGLGENRTLDLCHVKATS